MPANISDLATRIQTYQSILPAQTALLLSDPSDVAYLTEFGFLLPAEREAFVVVTQTNCILWYTSFSPIPAVLPCEARPMHGLHSVIQDIVLQHKQTNQQHIETVWFDAAHLTVVEHQQLSAHPELTLAPFNKELLWQHKMRKDASEQTSLRLAGEKTAQTLAPLLQGLQPGITEAELAWNIEKALKEAGASGLSFPTIVAFGDHTALPHHQPTQKILEPEMAVLIDVGGIFAGYCSDLTRSWWFGKQAPETYRRIESIVLEAYTTTTHWLEAELTARRSPMAKQIDQHARDIITAAGYGEQFIHTTGHGVGLLVHEPPSLNWRNTTELSDGMCITIEPGIYLPGQYGYRFENTLLLQSGKIEVLTQAIPNQPQA